MAAGKKKRQSKKGKSVTLKMAQQGQEMILSDKWRLNLSFKGITRVPKEILKVYGRDEVNLSRNLIRKLPDLSGMPNITVLDLHSNNLEQLPVTICHLENLEVLNLCNNRLTELPSELGLLKKLRTLHLGLNQLTALPTSFGELKELRHIGLSDNQFTGVPRCLSRLKKLEKINLERNPIPPEPTQSQEYTAERLCLVRNIFLCEDCVNNCRTERKKMDDAADT
ncbi:leucine-rich repeat-containing protein 18 [Hippoglossus hippoglossus]|uniref:leucine-rich repeat-containing protein 18 n=1 Tax=Hippoglossus hippoglossus TaxID=8267 RepID=UPI00148BFA14|nr:leucine-rich repeat-containing protein 18 [Hippoglossus hippoglossus]XP_035001949.1 leucine-rich repeat-containing protein 18 [Hippoglossus stenolepis]XP_035001951.1 leucine-rich repeat-containing protein 18 [Hippoglossus stenolepis]